MVFNPDIGGVPAPAMSDQTGASRGVLADRSWEHIFEGAGAAIKGGVDTYNNINKYQIDTAVREGFDKANAPYTETLPKELESAGSSVSALQNAYEQGKLTDTYYTGQLAALSKKLRSQYPQYEEYIDGTFMSITGIRPANAFKNAIDAELAAQATAAKDSTKAYDSWVTQNGDWIKNVIPDFFTNPEKYKGQEQFVKEKVFSAQSEVLTDVNNNRQMEMLAKQNALTSEQAQQGAIQSLNLTVQGYMDGINTASGIMNGKQVQERLTALATDGITPEEYAEGMQIINNFDLTIRQALTTKYNSAIDPTDPESMSLSALVNDASKMDSIIKQALAPWDAVKEYAVNKEWGLFTYYSRMNTLMKDKTVNDLLTSSATLSTANALNELGGSLMLDKFLTHNGVDNFDSILAEITPELTARTEAGYDSDFHSNVDIMLNSNKSDQEKAAGVNSLIDTSLSRIMDKDITPEGLANHVKSIYARDEKGISLFEKVPAGERETLYRNLFQPAVTDAIVKSGNQELMGLYYQSALANTKNIQSLREAAAAIQNSQEFNKAAYIQYNPGTATQAPSLSVHTIIPPGSTPLTEMFTRASVGKAQAAINSLNGVLATVNPVLTGLGVDDAMRNEQITNYLNMMSVDLGEAKKDNFFDMLVKGVQEGISNLGDTLDGDENAANPVEPSSMNLVDDTFTLGEISPAQGDYGTIANTIIGFEGYRDTAYYDVNAYRTGFGSDTVTAEDGTVSKVTKGTKISRADAERDLARRLNEEFVPDVVSDIGQDTWDGLSEKSQAALVSIAYNYGSLPTKVAKAAKTGDAEKLKEAIENLQSHNGGINRKRRLKEASMIS